MIFDDNNEIILIISSLKPMLWVFIRIVHSLCFLNLKFQASSHLLWLYSPVCVGPGQKPKDRFSCDKAYIITSVIISWTILGTCS